MDQWDASVVELLTRERRREDMERGEAARRLPRVPRGRPLRARLAAVFVVVAARLDPTSAAPQRQAAPLAPVPPA